MPPKANTMTDVKEDETAIKYVSGEMIVLVACLLAITTQKNLAFTCHPTLIVSTCKSVRKMYLFIDRRSSLAQILLDLVIELKTNPLHWSGAHHSQKCWQGTSILHC